MFRNISQEFLKLRSQRFFTLLMGIFLSLMAFSIYIATSPLPVDEELLFREKKHIEGYKENLATSIDKLRDRTFSPLIRNNQILKGSLNKQADSYEKLISKELHLEYESKRGVEYLSDTRKIDLALVGLTLVLGILIFNFDRQNKVNALIGSINKGARKKAISKLLLYLAMLFILSLISYLALIFLINYRIGFGKLDRSIQSVLIFKDANLNLSVGQYLLVFLMQKIISILFLASVFSLILSAIRDIRFQILAGAGFLIISYLASRTIGESSRWEFIGACSIFSSLNVFEIYGRYSDVYMGFVFVEKYLFSLIFNIFFSSLLTLLSYLVLKRELNDVSLYNLKTLFTIKPKSLFSFEAYRLIFQSFGLMAIGGFLLFSYIQLPKKAREEYDFLRSSYLYSLNEFAGKIDLKKMDDLGDKKNYYDRIDERRQGVMEDFEKGKIKYLERDARLKALDEDESRKPGFERVYSQAKSAFEKNGKDDRLYLMDERLGEYHFSYNKNTIVISIAFYLIMIFVVSESFIMDESLRMNSIIKTSVKGHLKILKKRIWLSYLFAFLLSILCFGLLYLDARALSKLLNLSAIVQSLPILLNFEININFGLLGLMLIAFSLINIYLLVNLIIYVGQVIKKRFGVYLALFICSLLPLGLSFFAGKPYILSLNPFSNIFSIAFSLGQFGFIGFMGQVFASIILALFLTRLNRIRWTGIE